MDAVVSSLPLILPSYVLIDQPKEREETTDPSIARFRKLNFPVKKDRGVIVRVFLCCGRRYTPRRFDRYSYRVALAIVHFDNGCWLASLLHRE